MNLKKSNYQIQVEKAWMEFPKWDHENIARKFNLVYDAHYLYIDFIGRRYRIDRSSGVTERTNNGISYDLQADFNEIMSIFDLFYYSKPELKLSGKWTGIQNVSGMAHSGQVVGSGLFTPYSDSFCGRSSELIKACVQLQGEEAEYADVCYIIKVFDVLPVMLQFWDGDDEFPAQIKFFWDKNILDFVHFETTFYIAFHLLKRIKEIMGD